MDLYQLFPTLVIITIGVVIFFFFVEQQNKEKLKEVLTLFSHITEEEIDGGKIHFWRGEYEGRKIAIRQKSSFRHGPRFNLLVDCNVSFDFDLFAHPVLGQNYQTKILTSSDDEVKTIGIRTPSASNVLWSLDQWLAHQSVQNALITLFNQCDADSVTTFKFEGPQRPRISVSAYWSQITKPRVLTMLTALCQLADTFTPENQSGPGERTLGSDDQPRISASYI